MTSRASPLVYAVIVNYNGARDTIKCLESLASLNYDNLRIVVVENGSTEAPCEALQTQGVKITVLHRRINQGFSVGCNKGVKYALERKPDFVWVLNNDTVIEQGALRAMVAVAERDSAIGGVGAVVREMAPPHRVQAWGGGRVDMCLGVPRHFARRVASKALHYLYGASMLLRREVLETVGLLDENFFLYFEDTDYGLRMREVGWKLAVADA